MQKLLIIITIIISTLSASIGLGTILDEGKAAFNFGSDITYIPKKPSSGETIEKNRTINASILFPSGIEFLYGKDAKYSENYLGMNYYFKHNNYTLSFNFKKHYDHKIMYRPKELGGAIAFKIKKQKIVPFVKYTYLSSKLNNNYKLLTFGGLISYFRFIFSLSYSFPSGDFKGLYNGKGNININSSIYLN